MRLHSDRAGGRRPRLVRCHDAAAEARAVVDAVLDAVEEGRRLRDQAVLMRAAHHSDLLEIELTARRVPFVKYGGLKFLEAAHVKDFIAGGAAARQPADEIAWFRLLRLHDGIGPARARDLLDTLRPADARHRDRHAEAVAAARAAARIALAATLAALAAARGHSCGRSGRAAIVSLLRPLLPARYPDHRARLGDLDRLAGGRCQRRAWLTTSPA